MSRVGVQEEDTWLEVNEDQTLSRSRTEEP